MVKLGWSAHLPGKKKNKKQKEEEKKSEDGMTAEGKRPRRCGRTEFYRQGTGGRKMSHQPARYARLRSRDPPTLPPLVRPAGAVDNKSNMQLTGPKDGPEKYGRCEQGSAIVSRIRSIDFISLLSFVSSIPE